MFLQKKAYFPVVLSLLLLLAPSLSGCIFNNSGEPDRLGSRGQINQSTLRPADWQQIVQESNFKLGEKIYAGTWESVEGDEKYYTQKFGTYPCIDGSTVAIPMALEFAWQHLGLTDEDANRFVTFSTTPYAYENLITGAVGSRGMIDSENAFLDDEQPVDLIIVTEPSEEELALAASGKVELIVEPLCYDAFVFITHKDNPVDSLTLDQVRDIYSGKITNWQEVGGNNEAIVPYQREEGSGSQTTMLSLVMGNTPMLPPQTIRVIEGMGSLVDTVAEYRNDQKSIGYSFRYYIDNLYKNEDIKILKIEGISSDVENLRTDSYPLTANYYGVIKKTDEAKTGGLFLDWMLSDEGQRCIEQAGYVPLRRS
jgi:phosphate transport system substrate-binding protein